MQLTDTHCHIDLPIFKNDLQQVLTASRLNGITRMVLPGVCRSGWQNLLEICSRENGLFPAIGLHPMYLEQHTKSHTDELAKHIKSTPLTALGEIGLDYYVKGIDHGKQQELFELQLNLAKKNNLPVLLHVRKAHDQVLATLRKKHFPHGGLVHAFSGSAQQAKQYINMGFKISFCGTITYDRATKIRKLATTLDLQDIVLETDSPDLPPANCHGERNSPANLLEITNCLARLRQQPPEHIATTTSKNAQTILQLQK